MRNACSMVLISSLFLASCSGNKSAAESGGSNVPAQMDSQQTIESMSVTETKGGRANWTLEASKARVLESDKRIFLDEPRVKFFSQGKYASTLRASSGTVSTENYDIWAQGDCYLETVKGEKLFAKNLRYRSDIQKIVTDDPIRLERDKQVITGLGMEATPDLEKIVIKKQRVVVVDNE